MALDRWYAQAWTHAADYESCLAQGEHAECGLQLLACVLFFLSIALFSLSIPRFFLSLGETMETQDDHSSVSCIVGSIVQSMAITRLPIPLPRLYHLLICHGLKRQKTLQSL